MFFSARAIWPRNDVLLKFASALNFDELQQRRAPGLQSLSRTHWEPLRAALSVLPFGDELRARGGSFATAVDQACVRIGRSDELTPGELEALRQVIRMLVPWRKGPFEVFGEAIDAEWRSDWKWSRIAPALQPLRGKKVADIGCSNGYYMFRASANRPELLIGFDPSESFYYAFEFFQRFLQLPAVQYELLGVEHLTAFANFFDVVLCCGILYHQRNPLEILQLVFRALEPGGQALIETQAIPGDGTYALFPDGRYAKARNIYFIPTADCVVAWLRKSGFTNVELVSVIELSVEEQRRTELAPYESLADFLDPSDRRKTVEGYPAPLRVAVSGFRPAK